MKIDGKEHFLISAAEFTRLAMLIGVPPEQTGDGRLVVFPDPQANERLALAGLELHAIKERLRKGLRPEQAIERNALRYRRLRENWIDCPELGLHGRLAVIDIVIDAELAKNKL